MTRLILVLLIAAGAGLWARSRRGTRAMPTIEEFRRMGPARATAWHRASGIEAKVVSAYREDDDGIAPMDPRLAGFLGL